MAEVKSFAQQSVKLGAALDLPLNPEKFNEEEVALYLKAHPDFLSRHPDLLETLELHHTAGSAISLMERQVEVLRGRSRRLDDRLKELFEVARENELRANNVQRLARTLIRAPTLALVVVGLTKCMRDDFDVDGVFVGVHPNVIRRQDIEGLHRIDAQSPIAKAYTNFFRTRLIECGPIDAAHAALFFPHAKTPMLSAAVVPLQKDKNLGLVVLASAEPERFQPRQGKLFLEMTAELVSAAIRARLG